MYGGQTGAIRESPFSNACDAVGNGYGSQTAATSESIVSNACDAVINRDGFNGTAIGIPRGSSFNVTNIGIIRHCSGAGDGKGAGFGVKSPCEVVAAGAGLGKEGSYACGKSKEESKKFLLHNCLLPVIYHRLIGYNKLLLVVFYIFCIVHKEKACAFAASFDFLRS